MKFFSKKDKQKKEEPELQEVVLTLYACRNAKDTEAVSEAAKNLFSDMMENIYYTDENEFLIRLKDETGIVFHLVTDKEETQVQANGMANFFSQAPLDNQKVKEAVICQISLFNCIIGIRFQIDENSNRTNYIVNMIYEIAKELCAFILHPNMHLYHSDGRLLLSIDGKSDYEEFYP